MSHKTTLSFTTISEALRAFPLPQTDCVVGIGRGGTVPASLIAHQLRCDLHMVQVNYRDDANQPSYEQPRWLQEELPKLNPTTRILLVDDVAVSGKTLTIVKSRLRAYAVTTLVLKGKADLVVFPTIATCVHWPWNVTTCKPLPTRSR